MAAMSPKYPLGSPQEHIPTCEKHTMNIDITCEDCDQFICSQCAKTNHKDHDWKTIPTAGSLRRRELKKTLGKVMEKDVKTIDEKIRHASKQLEDNQKCCDSEISKLQKHYYSIVSKLDEIKKNIETKLGENLRRKNAEVSKKKLDLEKKREHLKDLVKFLEEKHGTMSDYSLIDNLRDLANFVSSTDSDIEKGDHSVRYRKGVINEGLLETMIGQTFDLDNITVIETDYFQYGDKNITIMDVFNEDTCFVSDIGSECIGRFNIKNKKSEQININVSIYDACVADNGNVYITDGDNKSIVCLPPSGSVSTVFNTAPLKPLGICQSTEGGLLVTLRDTDDTENDELDAHSRRLVRHVTLSGEVIREYEYQEDGLTRLFNEPLRVRQNNNTDICVINLTSDTSSELVILSLSGSLKLVYRGKDIENNHILFDVVCDSHCNIIVSDYFNNKVHLLSPEGEFMKYLLTENQVTEPCSMSMYKSMLWVGDEDGLVKVFQYNT